MTHPENNAAHPDWFVVLLIEPDYGIFLQFGGATKDELDWEIEREFSEYDPPRPPSLGLWIWEGVMGEEGESTFDENDTWNLTFEGTFRRLLPHELNELCETGKLQR